MMKQSIRPTLLCAFGLLLLATSSVSAVVDFKVSDFGGGHQIWFEAEYFDERDPDNEDNFTLGNEPGAFGQSILSANGSDGAAFIRYSFDIGNAGGAGGTWYFWGRVINPSNSSDFMLVEGDPGDADAFPIVLPTGDLGNGRRVFEENAGDTGNWEWSDNDHDEGHTKTLQDGENTMYILNRQDGALWDVFMWTDDPDYVPTDEDYENAAPSNPFTARSPSPGSNSGDVPWFTDELSWSAGESAVTHNVYFSTNLDEVNDRAAAALVGEGLTVTSQAIGIELETTYYWAVDEVGGEQNFPLEAGATWNFTIENVANPIRNVTATSDNQFGDSNGAEKTVDGSGLADGLHGTSESDMWLSASLPATIQFDFDQSYSLHEMHIWNQNQSIEGLLGFGAKDVTLEVSTNGTDFTAVDGVGPLT